MPDDQKPSLFASQAEPETREAILSRVSGFLLITGSVGTVVYSFLAFTFLSLAGVSIPFGIFVKTLIDFSAYALIVYVPALIISLYLVINDKGKNIFGIVLLMISIATVTLGIIGAIKPMGY